MLGKLFILVYSATANVWVSYLLSVKAKIRRKSDSPLLYYVY